MTGPTMIKVSNTVVSKWEVKTSRNKRNWFSFSAPISNALCFAYIGIATPQATPFVSLECPAPMQGRYVSVQRVNNVDYFSAMEVEIFGAIFI